MSKLFQNYKIDLNNGTVWSVKNKRFIGKINKNGYHHCNVYDSYNNHYKYVHQIIVAEGLQLPKHLWPVDKNGKRFIVDHIIPVRNGGTDKFENLHLIKMEDNSRNPISVENQREAQKKRCESDEVRKKLSLINKGRIRTEETKKKMSEAKKGKHYSPKTEFKEGDKPWNIKKLYQYSLKGELVKIWESTKETEKYGFCRPCISMCCNHKLKTHKGFIWSYVPIIF